MSTDRQRAKGERPQAEGRVGGCPPAWRPTHAEGFVSFSQEFASSPAVIAPLLSPGSLEQ